jgi:serine/threonine protein kinase
MTTIPVTCAIHSDGSRVKSKIIGMGIDAFIIYNNPSTVLKIPKLYGQILPDGTMIPEPDNQWVNDLSIEKAIYERLANVPGIAKYLGATKDGLLLEYYKNGCLEDYMQENLLPPTWSQRMDWIVQIVDVYAACHARNVLVCDIALRNILLADDYTIRAIDFCFRWKTLASLEMLMGILRWWMFCMLRMLSIHSPRGGSFRSTVCEWKNGPKQKNYHRLLIYRLEISLQDRGLASSKLWANYDTLLYPEQRTRYCCSSVIVSSPIVQM